jgi:hypothetical protein
MTDLDVRKHLVWATRGRSWGFRFLLDAGLADPLLVYEEVFRELQDQPSGLHRVAGRIALRFPDPLGRRDTARRVIPHDFVVLGAPAEHITTLDDGLSEIWSVVEADYARLWDAEAPPSAGDLR